MGFDSDDVPVLIGDVRSGGQVEQDERVAKTIGDNGHSPDRNQTSPAMTRPPLPTIAATACETELTSQFASQWL